MPSGTNLNCALKEIAKLYELSPKLSIHKARHTFAVQYLNSGGDVYDLKELMGHDSIKSTMVYAKITNHRILVQSKKVFAVMEKRTDG